MGKCQHLLAVSVHLFVLQGGCSYTKWNFKKTQEIISRVILQIFCRNFNFIRVNQSILLPKICHWSVPYHVVLYLNLIVFINSFQPAKLAQSILLFCKGQGLLTSVALPGIERQRTFSGSSTDSDKPGRRLSRGMSMDDYDRPNIRRLSISAVHETIPPPITK